MKMKLQVPLAICMAVMMVITAGCSIGSKVTPEQKRLFAFGAVLAVRDGTGFDTLPGIDGLYKNAYIEGLKSSWEVTDHDTAIETLEWLKVEGHRLPEDETYYGLDEIFSIAIGRQLTDEEELELLSAEMSAFDDCVFYLIDNYGYTEEEIDTIQTVSAWDYDRIVTLSRWCLGVGYISEEEMWGYINWAAQQAVKDYGSWKEYFAGVMIGRSLWDPEISFEAENVEVADALMKSDKSPYLLYDFSGGGVKA